MRLVLGVGMRHGTSYDELAALASEALNGYDRAVVTEIVTLDTKVAEPALVRLAREVGAPVRGFVAEVLDGQPVASPSGRVAAAVGTASVAEAAVLAAGARLVVPKRASAGATIALGRIPAETADDGSATVAAPYGDAERHVVHRVLAERRDVRRGFVDVPVDDEVLGRILASAHRAPSVGLSQPWDFLLIREVATRRAVRDLAAAQRDAFAASLPADRRARFDGLKVEAILEAPLNIAVTCDSGRGGRHVLGRHADPRTTAFSTATAVQNLWLAARAEGVGVGWVSFFDPDDVARVLGLPAHAELVAYLCVGHVAAFGDTPELVRSGWAARRPLSWTIHHERWGRRGLPGDPLGSIAGDARQAAAAHEHAATGEGQYVRVLVTGRSAPEAALGDSRDLVVCLGERRPAPHFGVLWRPARSADEALEHGVEVVRDLWLQGVRRLGVHLVDTAGHTAELARGLELGARACGVLVEPQR